MLGIVGAIVGGYVVGLLLGRDLVTGFYLESVIVAFVGAAALIGVSPVFSGRGARA